MDDVGCVSSLKSEAEVFSCVVLARAGSATHEYSGNPSPGSRGRHAQARSSLRGCPAGGCHGTKIGCPLPDSRAVFQSQSRRSWRGFGGRAAARGSGGRGAVPARPEGAAAGESRSASSCAAGVRLAATGVVGRADRDDSILRRALGSGDAVAKPCPCSGRGRLVGRFPRAEPVEPEAAATAPNPAANFVGRSRHSAGGRSAGVVALEPGMEGIGIARTGGGRNQPISNASYSDIPLSHCAQPLRCLRKACSTTAPLTPKLVTAPRAMICSTSGPSRRASANSAARANTIPSRFSHNGDRTGRR